MGKYKIVTIERQFASGGKEIGYTLSRKLGISFYNEEILNKAADSLHLPTDYVRNSEETAPGSFIFGLVMAASANTIESSLPLSDRLFFEESKIIKNLAMGESCVIVGRCARQILSGRTDCLNVFIFSDWEARIKRAVEEYNIHEEDAAYTLKKNDKRRSNFYNAQAVKKWDDMYAYDLCLNSAKLGVDGCAGIISAAFNG